MAKVILAFMIALPLAIPAWTATGQAAAVDGVLEKRMMHLAEEFRCLVCQNQTIADSHADLAIDLKNQVRDQLRQGRTDDQIRAYMVERYGDFVLYRPPVKGTTVLLWFGPVAMVLAGLAGLALYLRQRRKIAVDDPADAGLYDDDYDIAPLRGTDRTR